MSKWIVITTINPPTACVFSYLESDWNIVVVGDRKTPKWDIQGRRLVVLDLDEQKRLPYRIAARLPFDHYARKMIGYVYAIKHGAEIIYDTDDDNFPISNRWLDDPTNWLVNCLATSHYGWCNVYRLFSDQRIWPRGLPLDRIDVIPSLEPASKGDLSQVKIVQFLANGDPDVDAIYRIARPHETAIFEPDRAVVLRSGCISPFNTQNTMIWKEVFPLLYLPATVSFRFTDILRAYVAQPLMWTRGYLLAVASPTVEQRRNSHNLYHDFLDEIDMYRFAEDIFAAIADGAARGDNLIDKVALTYERLCKLGYVTVDEMSLLEAWIADVQ